MQWSYVAILQRTLKEVAGDTAGEMSWKKVIGFEMG